MKKVGDAVILGTDGGYRTVMQRFVGGSVGILAEEQWQDGRWHPDPESGVTLAPDEVATLLRELNRVARAGIDGEPPS